MRKRTAVPEITLAPDALMECGATFHRGTSTIPAGTRARWADACVQTRPGGWFPVDAIDEERDAYFHALKEGLRPLTSETEPDAPKFMQAKRRLELVFVDPLMFLEGEPLGPMSRQIVEAGEVIPASHPALMNAEYRRLFKPVALDVEAA